MAIEETFADVKQEGDTDPFATLEKDTPSESQTEKEPKKEEPVVGDTNTPDKKEENVPFHEHPRWKQREEELETLRKQVADLTAPKPDSADSTVPEWFRELYGDNATAWEKYNENHTVELERIRQEAVQFVEQKQQAEVAETQKWNQWVETELGKLSSSGKTFDRNELINVMLTYRPTDTSNSFDFEAGFKIYEALKAKPAADPVKSQARKQLADTTTSTTAGEKKPKDYQTSATLRNQKWGSLT